MKKLNQDTKLSPAERMAKMLAFKPRQCNFTPTPQPAKKISVASSRFATA